jgi:hypothetical protein
VGRLGSIALVAAALAASCARESRPADAWTLHTSLERTRSIEVVAPDAATEAIVRAPVALRAIRAGYRVDFVRPGGPPRDASRVWIGDLRTPGFDPLLGRLGLERREQGGFRYLDVDYAGPRDALVATFEDPERPGMPMTMFLAGTVEGAARLARGFRPTARPGFRTWLDGAVDREGELDPRGDARRETVLLFTDLRKKLFAKATPFDLGGLEVVGANDFSVDAHRDWLERVESARGRCEEILFGEGSQTRAKVRLRVYTHPEDKLRFTRDGALASLNPLSGEVETVLAPWLFDDAGFGVARAQALLLRGDPGQEWMLDGVAAACSQTWWGTPMDEWLASLAIGGLVPGISFIADVHDPNTSHLGWHRSEGDTTEFADLFDSNAELSPHLAVPLRGALVRFAIERHGRDAMGTAWSTSADAPLEPALYDEFPAWLERTIGPHLATVRQRRGERYGEPAQRGFRKGVNLCAPAKPDDAFAEGFGSRAADATIARLRSLGANALALNWTDYLDPGEPAFAGDGATEPRSASASDLAICSSALFAARSGLTLLFKPQLLANRSGTWAGAAMLTNEQNQSRLFRSYERFAVHAGLLGELCGAEILCIGSEIPEASKTAAVDRNRREWALLDKRRDAWALVFTRTHGAFSGAVTYAARWDGEARGIEFWKQSDFIAMNLYASLAGAYERERPPRAGEIGQRLSWNLRELSELAQDRARPALITEIGCASTSDSWRDPSTMTGETDIDAQRRYYEGLDEALRIARTDYPDIKGVYFWNWTTDPRAGGSGDRGFSPQNKPAEAALARLFARL